MPSHYLNQCCNNVNWTLTTNFSEILIGIQTFSFKKMHIKMASAKWRPFCLGLNVLRNQITRCFRMFNLYKNNRITVVSHESQSVPGHSSHSWLDGRDKIKEAPNFPITNPLWMEAIFSRHKELVMRKAYPFYDVIMSNIIERNVIFTHAWLTRNRAFLLRGKINISNPFNWYMLI